MKFKDVIVVIPDGAMMELNHDEALVHFDNCSFVTEMGVRNGALSTFLTKCGISHIEVKNGK